jgi:hypothetical protein
MACLYHLHFNILPPIPMINPSFLQKIQRLFLFHHTTAQKKNNKQTEKINIPHFLINWSCLDKKKLDFPPPNN